MDSVKDLVDEIIIVDTGSKDRTKEIAHTYTDNVFDFVWIDDFCSSQKFCIFQSKMYVLYVARRRRCNTAQRPRRISKIEGDIVSPKQTWL